jgi:sugar phosphate isomerase/epimerase
MTTRRDFLTLSAKLAAVGCIIGRSTGAFAVPADGLIYGVQMYMVRKQAASDLAGAFKAVKGAGFDQVELFPVTYKLPPAALSKLLADAGLTSVSGHFDYTSREMSVEYAHSLGLKYLVCPMVPREQWGSLDGFHKAAEYFNQWGEATKKAGMQFAFHNHDYEFKPLEGSTGWAELMKGTEAKLVKLEFDLFWLATAGQDPSAMLKQYSDRAVLVHLKDRTAGAETSFVPDAKSASYCTELGKGTVDWPTLLRQVKQQGIRYAYLDQDVTTIPVDESMKESREYLRTLHL